METKKKKKREKIAKEHPTDPRCPDPQVRGPQKDALMTPRCVISTPMPIWSSGERKKSKAEKRFLLSSLLKTVFLDSNSMCTVVALRSRIAIARGMGVFFAFTRFCTAAIKAYLADGLSIVTSAFGKWKSFNRRTSLKRFFYRQHSFLSFCYFFPPVPTWVQCNGPIYRLWVFFSFPFAFIERFRK